jgi:hypothetical protein
MENETTNFDDHRAILVCNECSCFDFYDNDNPWMCSHCGNDDIESFSLHMWIKDHDSLYGVMYDELLIAEYEEYFDEV